MKRPGAVLCGALLVAAAMAGTGDKGLGVGLAGGNPSGVCFKAWLGEKLAVDGVLGYRTWGWAGLTVDLSVIHHDFGFWEKMFDVPSARLPLYYGVGGIAGYHFYGNPHYPSSFLDAGVYAKIGTAIIFEELPFDIFLEPGIGLFVLPGIHLGGVGKAGVRYWL